MTTAEDNNWLPELIDWLVQGQTDDLSLGSTMLAAVSQTSPNELDGVVLVLEQTASSSPELHAQRWQVALQTVAARAIELKKDAEYSLMLDAAVLQRLYEYLQTGGAETAAAHVLQVLAAQADADALDTLAEELTQLPPSNWQNVALALGPMWTANTSELLAFFDALGDEFLQPVATAVVLDLANYANRSSRLGAHPWTKRSPQLCELLSQAVVRLERLEQDPAQFGESVESIQNVLQESLALVVSLCDAIGLIGDRSNLDGLRAAMQLSHRRVQSEAAGALARLGDAAGRDRLVALASEPMARLRVVSYAEELDLMDEIAADFKLPSSLAESEFVNWLANPNQFGIPPMDVELIDSRTQYWPSFEEPQTCYLFRYRYQFADGSVSNIGIAGPYCHAFNTDLADLPIDDIYAAFAGWQAEHEEIFEVPSHAFNEEQRKEADRLLEYMLDHSLTPEKTIALTFFLGEIAVLAQVSQDARQAYAISDGQELLSYRTSSVPTAMSPDVVLCIYRGRKILRTFNP